MSSSLLNYVQGLGFSHVFAQALGADLSVTGPTGKTCEFLAEGICCPGASWEMCPTLTAR